MDTLSTALDYLRRGWSIIPIKPGTKQPNLKTWKKYQSERPTEAQAWKWFSKSKDGIGIICGKVSGGLTVIDFDEAELYQQWKAANPALAATLPTVKTGRGFHVYAVTDQTKTRPLEGIDIKASGYVIAPPSVHANGHRYQWTTPLNGQNLPKINLEESLLDTRGHKGHIDTQETQVTHRYTNQYRGVVCGGVDGVIRETLPEKECQRNKRLFLLAVGLRGMYENLDEAQPAVEKWHKDALPVIGTKPFEITWLEFRRAWNNVKHPAGSGELGRAIQVAKQRLSAGEGIQQTDFESDQVRLLLETCFVLSTMGTEGTFFLSCRKAGKVINHSHQTAAVLLQEFCERGYMVEVCKGTAGGRQSTVYQWAYNDDDIPF